MLDNPRSHDPLPTVWDPNSRVGDMLAGKRGLIVGVANEHSIAFAAPPSCGASAPRWR